MEIGFELLNMKTFHFTSEHRLKIYVTQNEKAFPKATGQDTFGYNGSLLPDTVVTATGRSHMHEFRPGLDAYMGKSAVSVNIPAENFNGMALWLENNAILSQGELQTYYMLRAIINEQSHPVSLLTTRVHWHSYGAYRICIESLNSLLPNQ